MVGSPFKYVVRSATTDRSGSGEIRLASCSFLAVISRGQSCSRANGKVKQRGMPVVEREELSVSGWAVSANMVRSWFGVALALEGSPFRPLGSMSLAYLQSSLSSILQTAIRTLEKLDERYLRRAIEHEEAP